MPQLAVETFVTQYFWLVVILFIFYYLSAAIIIPKISAIFKTRNKLSAINTNIDTQESNNILLGKSILSQAIAIQSSPIKSSSNYLSIFKKANKSWIKKVKKNTPKKKKSIK